MNRPLAPVIKSETFDKNHQMANFFLSTDNVMSAMSLSDLTDSVLAQTLTTNKGKSDARLWLARLSFNKRKIDVCQNKYLVLGD